MLWNLDRLSTASTTSSGGLLMTSCHLLMTSCRSCDPCRPLKVYSNRLMMTTTFLLGRSQEEDVNVVEHGRWLLVGWKPHLLPIGSAGVRRTRMVEAGPEQTSHLET